MPRLILIAAVLLTVFILVKRVQQLPPHKRRSGYLQLILGGAAFAAIILTLMGKMHWVGAALTGLLVAARQLLPILVRAFPLLQHWQQQRSGPQASPGQRSEVRSALLRMTLDHSSGELDGEVIEGPFKDWLLGEMSLEQLRDLLRYCRDHDDDSVQLLTSYLEQRFPDGFEDSAGASEQATGNVSSGMTRAEALAVLGLADDASHDDIVAAHRSLMQKIHPDRGGNDYLAAKINEAKDFLLKA